MISQTMASTLISILGVGIPMLSFILFAKHYNSKVDKWEKENEHLLAWAMKYQNDNFDIEQEINKVKNKIDILIDVFRYSNTNNSDTINRLRNEYDSLTEERDRIRNEFINHSINDQELITIFKLNKQKEVTLRYSELPFEFYYWYTYQTSERKENIQLKLEGESNK